MIISEMEAFDEQSFHWRCNTCERNLCEN